MAVTVKFALSFSGYDADSNEIDFYDAADALTGFQRSLALTAHLVLNGEIIVQAPYLKGARIMIKSPEPGSWKVMTTITMIAAGAHALGTAPRDSALGHLMVSAYDYVVNESLGFHVDFDSTLGKQYEEVSRQRKAIAPKISESQLDSLVEKSENSIKDMHRPIHASQSAKKARVISTFKKKSEEIATLNADTYDYIRLTRQVELPAEFIGRVSSYNINTYTGRIYLQSEQRPIPFELAEGCRDFLTVQLITSSLQVNARDRADVVGEIEVTAFRFESSTGRMKRILITSVSNSSLIERRIAGH